MQVPSKRPTMVSYELKLKSIVTQLVGDNYKPVFKDDNLGVKIMMSAKIHEMPQEVY